MSSIAAFTGFELQHLQVLNYISEYVEIMGHRVIQKLPYSISMSSKFFKYLLEFLWYLFHVHSTIVLFCEMPQWTERHLLKYISYPPIISGNFQVRIELFITDYTKMINSSSFLTLQLLWFTPTIITHHALQN